MTLKLLKIEPSQIDGKRYDAIFNDNGKIRRVAFGSSNHENFTMHKNTARRDYYRQRHKNDRLNDPTSPGALSWFILWNKPNLSDAIADYRKRFNV